MVSSSNGSSLTVECTELAGKKTRHYVHSQYIVVEVWDRAETLVVINYYNPCKKLSTDKLQQIQGQNRPRVVWCADFSAHSAVWGRSQTDTNGKVKEELLNNNDLVRMNKGNGTRINVTTGTVSALDITCVLYFSRHQWLESLDKNNFG